MWEDQRAHASRTELHAGTYGGSRAAYGVRTDKMEHFVETRANGLPWTREGCNRREDGRFVPWPDKAAAEAEIGRRRTDREEFDDPTWATAEYRAVPARRTG